MLLGFSIGISVVSIIAQVEGNNVFKSAGMVSVTTFLDGHISPKLPHLGKFHLGKICVAGQKLSNSNIILNGYLKRY